MVKEVISKDNGNKTRASLRSSHRPLNTVSLFSRDFDFFIHHAAFERIRSENDFHAGELNCILAIYYLTNINKSGASFDSVCDFLTQYTPISVRTYIHHLQHSAYIYLVRSQDLKNVDNRHVWKDTGYILTRLGEDVIRRLSAILTAERKKIYNPVKQK